MFRPGRIETLDTVGLISVGDSLRIGGKFLYQSRICPFQSSA